MTEHLCATIIAEPIVKQVAVVVIIIQSIAVTKRKVLKLLLASLNEYCFSVLFIRTCSIFFQQHG